VNTYNPLEEFLYGKSGGTEKRESGTLGSGFVVSEDGYVMTNNHVVDGADEIYVIFSDGREYKTKIVGRTPEIDIAILKIESTEKFKPIEFANSDETKIGQWAIAFGNPLGLNNTMTVGVVSATGRSSLGIEKVENFIQTDAAINQGNSGGPLIDINGRLIGINTAIMSQSGGSVGIGFAIPANLAKNVKDSIISTGKYERPFIGIQLQDLTSELAKQFGLKSTNGVLVSSVEPNSPAQKAGLQNGDVIIKLDNKAVHTSGALIGEIAAKRIGDNVTLTIIRDKKEVSVKVTLAKMDATALASTQSFSGLQIKNATPSGAMITSVVPNSVASQSGLQVGMIIKSLNRISTPDAVTFEKVYNQIKPGTQVLVFVTTPQGDRYTTIIKE
jgi:serine protease Do